MAYFVPDRQVIDELKARKVAEIGVGIDGSRDTCRVQECAMGDVVADATVGGSPPRVKISLDVERTPGLPPDEVARRERERRLRRALSELPELDALVLSHAHADHMERQQGR